MRIQPLISILVPVYNSEKYLRRFLDSAVQQTYNNIEIICVDNLSEDNSYGILIEYQQRFPEKVFVYQVKEHYDYVGAGRNIAYRYSHGEYLYFCDSDDIIQYKAIEVLYNTAFTYDSDLVCGYAIAVLMDENGIAKKLNLGFKRSLRASNDTAITSGVELWMRLIKRSLFEKTGLFPENVIFDDVAQLTVIQSYAENIRFLQYPVYYYFRRDDSTAGRPSLAVALSSIKAERYALNNCNPTHKDAVLKFVALRIKANLDARWQYIDYFIDWIKELMPLIQEDELIITDQSLYPTLKFLGDLKDVKIPHIVYVSGLFGKQVPKQRIEELEATAFAEGCRVVILDESNCDLDENPYIRNAVNDGNFNLIEGYFALKKIYENGGIYIHDSVRIVSCFNFCKYLFGFFGFENEVTYTDKVFGASKKNDAFKSLLDTFSDEWDKKGEYFSLSDRIGIILTIKYDIPLDGKSHLYQKPVSVLQPSMLVVNVSDMFGRFHCISSITPDTENDDIISMKKSTLKCLLSLSSTKFGAADFSGKTPREVELERELYNINMSNTWKITQKLRKIGDGPFGPFLKKVFRKILKIRAMFKK